MNFQWSKSIVSSQLLKLNSSLVGIGNERAWIYMLRHISWKQSFPRRSPSNSRLFQVQARAGKIQRRRILLTSKWVSIRTVQQAISAWHEEFLYGDVLEWNQACWRDVAYGLLPNAVGDSHYFSNTHCLCYRSEFISILFVQHPRSSYLHCSNSRFKVTLFINPLLQ